MNQGRCPGTDMRYWSFDDIYEIRCPRCGTMIEFFKDDPSRICHGCGERIRNPRLQKGCAEWCPMAGSCGEAQRKTTNHNSVSVGENNEKKYYHN